MNLIEQIKVNDTSIDGYQGTYYSENPELIRVILDSEGKVISYRDSEGVKHEEVGIETNHLELTAEGMTEFQQALKDAGFNPGGGGDWSDKASIEIPEPRLAFVNITNDSKTATFPTSKTEDAKYWIEFFDGYGNYFRKRIILNAQGNSSMAFEKKNGNIDICNDEWIGDDTCNVKFGDLPATDSYHLKGEYPDFFRGSKMVAYKLIHQVDNTLPFDENRIWKKALLTADDKSDIRVSDPSNKTLDDIRIQVENPARCVPDGFPVILHMNGDFYGVYIISYKKHRSNYLLDKSTDCNIHLDGDLNRNTIFGGNIDWYAFEIRNPKYLVYQTPISSFDPTNKKQVKAAYEYDADKQQSEIAGTDSPIAYSDNTLFLAGQMVIYGGRMYMAMRNTLGNTPTKNKKPKNVYEDAAVNGYWIDITYTNTVKQYIINLSNRMAEIQAGANVAEQRSILEQYFDIANLVDYELLMCVLHNIDGQGYNWQLITYDGIKWWFCHWDSDRILGETGTFNLLTPAPRTGSLLIGSGAGTPNEWINNNCFTELKTRWNELVTKGVFTADNVISLFKDWMDRIGIYYEKEYEVWPDSPCNRDSNLSDKWSLTGSVIAFWINWNSSTVYSVDMCVRDLPSRHIYKAIVQNTNKKPSDNPDIWEDVTYTENKNYSVGETCWYSNFNAVDDAFMFECKEATNEPPLIKVYNTYPCCLGYHDNAWRLYTYIKENFKALNIMFNN